MDFRAGKDGKGVGAGRTYFFYKRRNTIYDGDVLR